VLSGQLPQFALPICVVRTSYRNGLPFVTRIFIVFILFYMRIWIWRPLYSLEICQICKNDLYTSRLLKVIVLLLVQMMIHHIRKKGATLFLPVTPRNVDL